MDILRRMSQALDYIEENLRSEIDLETVAKKAHCSNYNFQRMFSFITDVTLAEYIRRRRLTLAALEVQNSKISIVDLSVKYGYDSSAAFSRAFYHLHGIKPSSARNEGVALKAYPKITLQISIQGEKSMEYRIESKPAFDIYGIETICSTIGNENFLTPAQLWQQNIANEEINKLEACAGKIPDFIGKNAVTPDRYCIVNAASFPHPAEKNTFKYMLFCFKGENSPPSKYVSTHVPAATYVIFPMELCKWEEIDGLLSKLQKRIFTEWFPTSDYELADTADFVFYGASGELAYLELWYPLKKKV